MDITIDAFVKILNNRNIRIENFREHSKASEKYVDVVITQSDGFVWEGAIPYSYRRTGLFIETPQKIAAYLNGLYDSLSKESVDTFIKTETERWDVGGEFYGKAITKEFFDKLLNLKWNSVKYDFPANLNWARRIQNIKDIGYTLATDTCRKVAGRDETGTHILLVPIAKGGVTGYETMSATFKAKVVNALLRTNIYELSSANKHGLIPDHKFPEIRWDEATKAENLDDMTTIEIMNKFQLLNNQRNLQKREICRKCFQTGKRGIIYGVKLSATPFCQLP